PAPARSTRRPATTAAPPNVACRRARSTPSRQPRSVARLHPRRRSRVDPRAMTDITQTCLAFPRLTGTVRGVLYRYSKPEEIEMEPIHAIAELYVRTALNDVAHSALPNSPVLSYVESRRRI